MDLRGRTELHFLSTKLQNVRIYQVIDQRWVVAVAAAVVAAAAAAAAGDCLFHRDYPSYRRDCKQIADNV